MSCDVKTKPITKGFKKQGFFQVNCHNDFQSIVFRFDKRGCMVGIKVFLLERKIPCDFLKSNGRIIFLFLTLLVFIILKTWMAVVL